MVKESVRQFGIGVCMCVWDTAKEDMLPFPVFPQGQLLSVSVQAKWFCIKQSTHPGLAVKPLSDCMFPGRFTCTAFNRCPYSE